MPTRSVRSAGATFLNKDARIAALREAAARASNRIPTIRRVILFGSLVVGIPTQRSDADVLVEVSSSEQSEPRDRIPGMLKAFSPLPCPIDLFVLTTAEIRQHQEGGSALLREILSRGVDLLGQESDSAGP